MNHRSGLKRPQRTRALRAPLVPIWRDQLPPADRGQLSIERRLEATRRAEFPHKDVRMDVLMAAGWMSQNPSGSLPGEPRLESDLPAEARLFSDLLLLNARCRCLSVPASGWG
jgi:hypothetical protein